MNKEKHIHYFKRTGGGCLMDIGDKNKQCDDDYECACGAKIHIKCSKEVHFSAPAGIIWDEDVKDIEANMPDINKESEE